MNYAEKFKSGEMMYGPAPKIPTIINTEAWDHWRAGFNRRAGRDDLLLPDGRAVRYDGKHRPLSKLCACKVCKAKRKYS